jgi:hypothetical protein
MPNPNSARDSEIPAPTRAAARIGGFRPAWWRRAVSYGLNRLADNLSGTRRTPLGQGRQLLRERRNLNLARTT